MIADRRYLAAQLKELQQRLRELADWTDNPDKPFPGDAAALGDLLGFVAKLMLTGDDTPSRTSSREECGGVP